MFYNDARHPAIYMYEPPMEKEQFEAAVDEVLGTPVDAMVFGLGDGRTVFHKTEVGELWGDPVEKWPHLIFRRAHQNAKMMLESGRDPLRIVCDHARANGLMLYPSLLLNRGRGADRHRDVRAANFTWENRHLEIGAGGDLDESFNGARQLDFKHQEVQDERFALIEEVLKNYPIGRVRVVVRPPLFLPPQGGGSRPGNHDQMGQAGPQGRQGQRQRIANWRFWSPPTSSGRARWGWMCRSGSGRASWT